MLLHVINCCVLVFFANARFSSADESDPIVTLPNGQIKGHVLTTAENNVYHAFQEIPYASPPVGDLRFKEPVPPSNWNGVLDTTKNTKICYQQAEIGMDKTPNVTETEDCLYLNVYKPLKAGNSSDTLLPVLVWIHGGAYKYGDGTFQLIGPQFFIDQDLVVVVLNYRLGALGFLTTEDGFIPGNLGLKDQNLALQWVNQNIQLFGGDPAKVTVAGESAGGGSVGLQLISAKSEGLFRGVILQSGNGLCSFSRQKHAKYFAFELGRTLDPTFTSEDSADLLKLLQESSASDITLAEITVPLGMETQLGDHLGLIWVPVIEDSNYTTAFITGPMHEDVKNGNINQVSTLIGFTSQEYIGFTDKEGAEELASNFDEDLKKLINDNFDMTDKDKYTVGGKLREIYTTGLFRDHLGAVVRLMTDSTFANPSIRQAELQSNYSDVYMYQFSFQGPLGLLGGLNTTIEGVDDLESGVSHSADLRYMWSDSRNSDIYQFPVSDILTHKRVVKLWSNFVKYLNPTPEKDILLQNVIWPKVSPNNLQYLDIDITLKIKTDPKKYKEVKEVIDAYAIPPLINY